MPTALFRHSDVQDPYELYAARLIENPLFHDRDSGAWILRLIRHLVRLRNPSDGSGDVAVRSIGAQYPENTDGRYYTRPYPAGERTNPDTDAGGRQQGRPAIRPPLHFRSLPGQQPRTPDLRQRLPRMHRPAFRYPPDHRGPALSLPDLSEYPAAE